MEEAVRLNEPTSFDQNVPRFGILSLPGKRTGRVTIFGDACLNETDFTTTKAVAKKPGMSGCFPFGNRASFS
jgi:hypothetical protein